jgi:hypothetical protein
MRQGAHEGGDHTTAEKRKRETTHHIAFFTPILPGGGVGRVMINLASTILSRRRDPLGAEYTSKSKPTAGSLRDVCS